MSGPNPCPNQPHRDPAKYRVLNEYASRFRNRSSPFPRLNATSSQLQKQCIHFRAHGHCFFFSLLYDLVGKLKNVEAKRGEGQGGHRGYTVKPQTFRMAHYVHIEETKFRRLLLPRMFTAFDPLMPPENQVMDPNKVSTTTKRSPFREWTC